MIVDTIEVNSRRNPFPDQDDIWLFGYGSLIFKADFDYLQRCPARISGWARRFWQGSPDHRGTPDAPGRVVTLIELPSAVCGGMAYRVKPTVLGRLDVREKNGYQRFVTPMTFRDGNQALGLVYIATPDNDAFLGPAPAAAMAAHIYSAAGPSGANRDYLIRLADALRALNDNDPHIFALEQRVLALTNESANPAR